MVRRSPIKHHVRSHQRATSKGKTAVHTYERGKGERKPKLSKPQLRKPNQKQNSYVVRINYIGQPTDNIPVSAGSYPEAIEQAMMTRVTSTPPSVVEVFKQ